MASKLVKNILKKYLQRNNGSAVAGVAGVVGGGRNDGNANSMAQKDYSTENPSVEFAPLKGVRVLDVTRVLAGPYCTMILGDLGAEIIKIEKPETGDDTRSWGPPWVGTESAYFLSVNRNKKSVCVDMKTKEGSQIIRQLASMSDVFIENYVPNKLDEYQLGYEDLKKVNSKIIYCSITGFGPSGPYKHRGGYDLIATALGGLMYITGPEDGDPCRTGVALTDLHTGQYAVSSILASLLYRNERNTGIHIHCSLLNTQVASLTHIASNWLNCGQDAKRMGSGHPSIVPYQSFKTKDNGYFIIGAGNNDQFEELCEILNLSHLPKDDKFSSNAKRVANRKELNDIFTKKFATQTRQFWVEYFKKTQAEFPYGPINSIKEAFQDPQVRHNHMIQAMDHSSVGTIKVAAPPVQYDDVRLALQNPPPLLGEHTDEVLRQLLKYNQGDIEEMKRKKIIE